MVIQNQLNQAAEYLKKHCIALTGGIATGKSTVAKILREFSFIVIDADVLARKCVLPGQPALAEIKAQFGDSVIGNDGTLNRSELRQMIFADRKKRAILETIMHPAIQNALLEEVLAIGAVAKNIDIFYEASLIIETGTSERFRAVWCTLCTPSQQLSRLMSRDNIDSDFAKSMIAQQMPAKEKAAHCKVTINTELNEGDLRTHLRELVEQNKLNFAGI